MTLVGELKATEFALNDAGNAELFADLYKNIARYDHKYNRWLLLNDESGIWEPDIENQVHNLATEANRYREDQARSIDDDDKRKRVITWAINSNSLKKIEGMIKLAQSKKPLSDNGENWDMEPLLIGCPNGVIDLTTGELRKGKPEDKITMRVTIPYDKSLKIYRWDQFLKEVFEPLEDRDEVIHWLQMALGYSLTRSTQEQIVFFCYGGGSNGKSVMFSTLLAIFGVYGHEVAPTLLQESTPFNTSTLDLVALENKRFAISSETLGGQKINASRLKQLSGGDLITARGHYEKFRTFESSAKLWLFTNDKPVIEDDSYAMWRRIRAIPFQRTFKGADADPNLQQKLKSESQGILTWLVEGAVMWQNESLKIVPKSIQDAIADYQRESDPLISFIEDKCIVNSELEETSSLLFLSYDFWATEQGIPQNEKLTKRAFGLKMSAKFNKRHSSTKNIYIGIGLKANSKNSSQVIDEVIDKSAS